MYLEYDCRHCGYEWCTVDTKETEYKAQLECVYCGHKNEVVFKITAVGLPLKED